MFYSSSMDSLLPLEIELAERLIAYFLPGFVFSAKGIETSVYWVDPATPQPPVRLARMPAPSPTLRFFQPGTAQCGRAGRRGRCRALIVAAGRRDPGGSSCA